MSNQLIQIFSQLGEFLSGFSKPGSYDSGSLKQSFENTIRTAHHKNPWFTEDNIRYALKSLAAMLREDDLREWLSQYPNPVTGENSKKIGVVSAGNIPLVGFHDMLCVLASGHAFYGKLSSKDNLLLPLVADYLIDIQPDWANKIVFEEENLKSPDAIIATGSDNSSRYFEYYFGKYPHIIRGHRNGLAVLSGKESPEDLRCLGEDIFTYFGMGCRSVSKLMLPAGYCFDDFFESIASFGNYIHHHKYANNFEYHKSVYLMNRIQHLDNGFMILKEDEGMASPLSVVYYSYYNSKEEIIDYIHLYRDKIQCIVGNDILKEMIPFGQTQKPKLWDYADEKDTLNFLHNL